MYISFFGNIERAVTFLDKSRKRYEFHLTPTILSLPTTRPSVSFLSLFPSFSLQQNEEAAVDMLRALQALPMTLDVLQVQYIHAHVDGLGLFLMYLVP